MCIIPVSAHYAKKSKEKTNIIRCRNNNKKYKNRYCVHIFLAIDVLKLVNDENRKSISLNIITFKLI